MKQVYEAIIHTIYSDQFKKPCMLFPVDCFNIDKETCMDCNFYKTILNVLYEMKGENDVK